MTEHQHAPHDADEDFGHMFTQEFWDDRYGSAEQVWSGKPNAQLVMQAAGLSPGEALEVGCGEGADAIWLAAQGWRVRLTVAAGTVAAVVLLGAAVVFGTSNGAMRQQLDQAQASSQQVAAVLTARDAIMMTGTVTGGGTVTIVMSPAMGELVFTAAGLHALPASRGYELWLIGPAGERPAGLLPLGSSHMTGPVIASGLRSGDHLALSAEPASGASHPTTPMMLDLAL